MTLQQVLQVGSRLFKHFGSPAGRMAIYPKRDDRGWFLLVKAERELPLASTPNDFEGIPVDYERY